jgi:hypothetical protein
MNLSELRQYGVTVARERIVPVTNDLESFSTWPHFHGEEEGACDPGMRDFHETLGHTEQTGIQAYFQISNHLANLTEPVRQRHRRASRQLQLYEGSPMFVIQFNPHTFPKEVMYNMSFQSSFQKLK